MRTYSAHRTFPCTTHSEQHNPHQRRQIYTRRCVRRICTVVHISFLFRFYSCSGCLSGRHHDTPGCFTPDRWERFQYEPNCPQTYHFDAMRSVAPAPAAVWCVRLPVCTLCSVQFMSVPFWFWLADVKRVRVRHQNQPASHPERERETTLCECECGCSAGMCG